MIGAIKNKGAWKKVPLRDYCEVLSGATPRRDTPEYWGGDVPWVTPKDISNLEVPVLDDAPEKITELGYKSCSTTLLPKGAILFSSRAPIGLVAIAGREMCTNQGFKSVVPGPRVDSGFLYWYLRQVAPMIAARGTGTTFKEISKEAMERVEIPLPSLEEQRRIAAILEKADAIRRKRQETLSLSASLIRSAFLDIFGDPVYNPKGWPKCSIMDVAHVTDGTHDTPEYVESGYPLVTSKNLKKDGLDFKTVQYISEKDHNKISVRSAVNRGDILFAMIGTIGNATIVETDRPFSVKNVALFKPNSKTCSTYVWSILRDNHYLSSVLGMRLGGNQPFVGLGTLRSLVIPVPPIALQKKYNQMISRISALVQKQKKSLQESENMFNSLQSELF